MIRIGAVSALASRDRMEADFTHVNEHPKELRPNGRTLHRWMVACKTETVG